MITLRRAAVLALLAGIAILVAVGWREAQRDPVVHYATIPLRALPRGAPPLRLALVSDIHVGNLAMPAARLNRIVDQINTQHADAILLAGDFVNGASAQARNFTPRALVGPLSRLRAPLGVFAVLGNHDAKTSPALVARALQDAGVTVLINRTVRIGGIALTGLDPVVQTPTDVLRMLAEAQPLGGVPVVMAHWPQAAEATPLDVPLILAGHTHCGQIVIGSWSNAFDYWHGRYRFPPRLRCGLVHDFGRTVIVTGGVGASSAIPLRINAPPDFWVITLVGPR